MRIAYLTQSYPPMISGAAILVERLAISMAKQGHQVLVIAASDKTYPYRSYQENLTIVRLRSIHNPLRVGQRFLLYPRVEALQVLRQFCPDIIHTHEPLLMGQVGKEYARSCSIPILLTVHQLPWFVARYLPNLPGIQSNIESTLWIYARRLLQEYTSVITPSQTISDLVARMTGIQPTTISNGIALNVFQPSHPAEDHSAIRARLHLPADIPVILHVGRLDVDKNVGRVVQAAVLAMEQTKAHLLIVGDGSQKHALMKMCYELKIGDRVHFPGYMSLQDGLPEVYRLADIFVTASEIEVQSLVLLEAIASGLPIVAVRASFVPEVVHHEVNGFLAEPGDINGLARAISTLLKNPKQKQGMGKRSRQLAEAHNFQVSIELHEQLCASLLDQFQRVKEKMKRQPKAALMRT